MKMRSARKRRRLNFCRQTAVIANNNDLQTRMFATDRRWTLEEIKRAVREEESVRLKRKREGNLEASAVYTRGIRKCDYSTRLVMLNHENEKINEDNNSKTSEVQRWMISYVIIAMLEDILRMISNDDRKELLEMRSIQDDSYCGHLS